MPDAPDVVARGVPLIDDRLLLELANDLHTAEDLARARSREGFFARLLGRATGRHRVRERNIQHGLINSQRLTLEWLTSLTERMTVTNLVVAEVTDEVNGIRHHLAGNGPPGAWSAEGIDELGTVLARLARDTGRFLSDHERRLAAVEAQLALDASVRRWRRPRPDPGLPWLVGAVLLAREVAAGPAGEYAFGDGTGRTGHPVRRELAERMLQDPPVPWFDGVKSVVGMIAAAVERLPSDDHRRMVAELLGVGLNLGRGAGPGDGPAGPADRLAGPAGPLTSALAITADLVAAGAAPAAEAARKAVLAAGGPGDRFLATSLSVEQLVRRVVDEQFTEAATRRAHLRAPGAYQAARREDTRREDDRG
ncbi:hypothetical protein [Streptomyces marincola]|uniref:hypothetical protein n=1 Tax=Streptomyces marincola TaxID=2878388 RepID=UPI001CF4B66E|nr:hypothetical protein [Streptomyces marincola]UCM88815.1 hypothetical protein LC193_13110 [Streptomyces marincola]